MTLTMLRKNRKEREVLRKEREKIRVLCSLCVNLAFFAFTIHKHTVFAKFMGLKK
jgi:hypothetical protein